MTYSHMTPIAPNDSTRPTKSIFEKRPDIRNSDCEEFDDAGDFVVFEGRSSVVGHD